MRPPASGPDDLVRMPSERRMKALLWGRMPDLLQIFCSKAGFSRLFSCKS